MIEFEEFMEALNTLGCTKGCRLALGNATNSQGGVEVGDFLTICANHMPEEVNASDVRAALYSLGLNPYGKAFTSLWSCVPVSGAAVSKYFEFVKLSEKQV